ncbi:MAG: tetratricopeptide repeat protein [Candidatus Thorarchaeota archaeon]|nr:tetratricopeptide repeat protein [Candidatus Thorarchaeota archaeon]
MTEKVLESARKALEECRPHDAIVALEPLVEYDDEDVDALVCLGIAYVQAEMPEKAVDVLSRADELVEMHYVVELFLGRALWALGKIEAAEDRIREALKLDSTEPEPWIDLGRIMMQKKEYRDAIDHLRLALSHFPDEITLVFLHALVLYRLGDFTAATEEWGRVHRLQPNLMTAISNYAYILLLQNRVFEAAPFVGHANTMDPDDYRSLILLGELRYQSGDHEGALECFGKVLDLDPINIEALSRMAVISHNAKNDVAAKEYLRRAELELGRDPESWRGLCSSYPLLDMQEDYVDCLIRWTKADKNSAAPWVILAHEYDKVGKIEYARNTWRVVFELRGYVKCRCASCENEKRIPYNSTLGFDVYSDLICESCGSVMRMPASMPID